MRSFLCMLSASLMACLSGACVGAQVKRETAQVKRETAQVKRETAQDSEPTVVVRLVEARDIESRLFACEPDPRTRGLLCTDLERFLLYQQTKQAEHQPTNKL